MTKDGFATATAIQNKLSWPARPKRGTHQMLGRSQMWTSRCGQYRVERFLEASGQYLALRREPLMGGIWSLIRRHRKLAAAQKSCEQLARKDQANC